MTASTHPFGIHDIPRPLAPFLRRPWGILWCGIAMVWAIAGCTVDVQPTVEPPVELAIEASSAIGDREGLPAVPWQDARQVVRRRAVVFGEIVDVGGTSNIQFLNFSRRDRQAFVAVVFARSWPNFPQPLRDMYLNQRVEIEGHVTLFEGRPQIVVSHPRQIRIVDELPARYLPQDRARFRTTDEIEVATLNVRNLFDAYDDPYTHDESTPQKPRDELEALASTIRSLNADVLALQEVENRGVLARFLEVFLSDMGYRHVVLVEGNDLRGIDVAVVSRVPLGEVRSQVAVRFDGTELGTDRFQRDLLCVEVLPAGGSPFEVWVVHLKSKSGDVESSTEPVRLAEASQIRKLVDRRLQQDPDAQFLICGDFNDEWGSRSLRTIVGEPGEGQLASFFESIPQEDRITFNQEPYLSMIDFILSSPAMARRYLPGSYRIVLGDLANSGTDHNPVRARFRAQE